MNSQTGSVKNKPKCLTEGKGRGGSKEADTVPPRPLPSVMHFGLFFTVPVWLFIGIPYSGIPYFFSFLSLKTRPTDELVWHYLVYSFLLRFFSSYFRSTLGSTSQRNTLLH